MGSRTSRIPLPLVLAAALAAAALSAGCGSDEMSAEAFTAQADEICRSTQREFAEIQRVPPKTADQAEKQADALIDISEGALERLRGLDPPEESAAAYDRYLAARERAIGYLQDGRDAAVADDPKAYAAAKQMAAREQGNRLVLARKAGLEVCSRPSVRLGGG